MSAERVACKACGQWVFHLATTCPHCGARQGAAPAPPPVEKKPPAKPIELTDEEKRALLSVSLMQTSTGERSLLTVAKDFVLSRGTVLDLGLSVLAAPLTVFTVVTLGYVMVRQDRAQRDGNLEGTAAFAVPACSIIAALTFATEQASTWAWVVLGVSFTAWLVRTIVRARRRPNPLD